MSYVLQIHILYELQFCNRSYELQYNMDDGQPQIIHTYHTKHIILIRVTDIHLQCYVDPWLQVGSTYSLYIEPNACRPNQSNSVSIRVRDVPFTQDCKWFQCPQGSCTSPGSGTNYFAYLDTSNAFHHDAKGTPESSVCVFCIMPTQRWSGCSALHSCLVLLVIGDGN